jgi:hypothetical protein
MADTKNSPPGPFAPYVNAINMDDPLMKRVPFNMMDIGANSASMPSGMMGMGKSPGSIEHVGMKPTRA